uniref:Uncharacterized protein n=1 Tax=Oryza glumipatula TaxID=40148 RepID=A0A0D9Z2A7_9ORYZ
MDPCAVRFSHTNSILPLHGRTPKCRVCIVLIWACYGRATLYWLIAALLPALDGVAVSHLCRDENKVAHGFAKLGHKARHPTRYSCSCNVMLIEGKSTRTEQHNVSR